MESNVLNSSAERCFNLGELAMDELLTLAIASALSTLEADREEPGSQEAANLEAAREILTRNKCSIPQEIAAEWFPRVQAAGAH
jgi:hypothetical protein